MSFLGRCYGCRNGRHDEHEEAFDSPPADSMICGGGICVCGDCVPEMAHLDAGSPLHGTRVSQKPELFT